LNLGFGAGTFTSDDFAGFNTGNPTVMDPFYVSGGSINPYGADLSGFNYYMPGFGYTDFFVTPGAGENFGGGLLGRPAGTSTPTILDPYTVTGTRINDPSLTSTCWVTIVTLRLSVRSPIQMRLLMGKL
jgi:hypothetical protein